MWNAEAGANLPIQTLPLARTLLSDNKNQYLDEFTEA